MTFVKREVPDNFVSLGDGEGDVVRVGGILTRFVENNHFAKPKTDYEYIDKKGDRAVLSGSASLSRQIHNEDIGKFFKAEFEGWGKSANGNFKKIAVYMWDGEPTEQMKKWPRFAECYGPKAPAPAAPKQAAKQEEPDDFPDAPPEDDDDLPF